MSKSITELNQDADDILMSPTFQKLVNFSQNMTLDVNNEDDLKTMLSTSVIELCKALDDGRIHFDDNDDKGIFHGLLTVGLVQFFDGKVDAVLVKNH